MAYNNRGVTYRNMGDFDKSIADCSEAIRLDPKNDMAYYNRSLGYYYKNKDFDRAIADCTQAIKINPNEKGYSDVLEALQSEKANQYDPAKFIVVPTNFKPANYTKIDLFDAVAKIENPASASELSTNQDALANALMQAFGADAGLPTQYVSDLVLTSQSGTTIYFKTSDNAITKDFTISSRSGLTVGQKARIYYSVQINNNYPTLLVWKVDSIERL